MRVWTHEHGIKRPDAYGLRVLVAAVGYYSWRFGGEIRGVQHKRFLSFCTASSRLLFQATYTAVLLMC